MVDFKALHSLARPVSLAEIKADGRLDHIALIRQSRLSVMPLDDGAWRIIAEMGGSAP
jgi:predicted RNA-binding protein with PUA-like domain